jgi:hypothetical protein
MGWRAKSQNLKTKGFLDDALLEEMAMWRLIQSGVITLTEAKTTCTLDDAMRLIAIMDYKQMLEELNS